MEIDNSPVIVEVGDQMLAQLVRVNPGTTTGTTLSLVQRQRQLAIRSTAAFDIFWVAIRAWFPADLTNGLNEYGGWLGPPTAGRSLRGNLLMWQGVLKVQFGRQVTQPVIWKGKKKRGKSILLSSLTRSSVCAASLRARRPSYLVPRTN